MILDLSNTAIIVVKWQNETYLVWSMISSLSLDSEGPLTVEERRLSLKWDSLEDLHPRSKRMRYLPQSNLPMMLRLDLSL